MIVLEPAPPAPRRAATRPEAGAAPDPEKAGDFEAHVAKPEREAPKDAPIDAAALLVAAAPPTPPPPEQATIPGTNPAAIPVTVPATSEPVAATASPDAMALTAAMPPVLATDAVPARPAIPQPAAAVPTVAADTASAPTRSADDPAPVAPPPAASADEATRLPVDPATAPLTLRAPLDPTASTLPPLPATSGGAATPTPPSGATNTPAADAVPPPAAPEPGESPRPEAAASDPGRHVLVRITPAMAADTAPAPTAQLGAADAIAAPAPAPVAAAASHGPIGAHAAADPQAVVGQIAAAVAKSDHNRVEIRLDPPELGRVHIHLTTVDGGVQAVVAAQRPETQDLLRRHAEALAQELTAAGYGDVSLDFATGNEAAPGRDDRQHPDWHAVAFAPVDAPASAAAPRAGVAGALDIRL